MKRDLSFTGAANNFYADGPEKIEWQIIKGLTPYELALREMEKRAEAIFQGRAPEAVWLLEHPPLYTAGTSARQEDLLDPSRFPVYKVSRGGQYTYHGPGQRVIYLMLNLKKRKPDIRAFIAHLEQWIINMLARFSIKGERRDQRIGVWVADKGQKEKKIAAIGVRLRKWVSFHGISINIKPDLSHYAAIVPCGIREYAVTSFDDLGAKANLSDIDRILAQEFTALFGPIIESENSFPARAAS